ncbi:MAG: UDP-N-acetylmuramoyl-L-alanyl-D-glutamate--2,6-diaminopimelate ligase [Propionibacteriaceae bacterium]
MSVTSPTSDTAPAGHRPRDVPPTSLPDLLAAAQGVATAAERSEFGDLTDITVRGVTADSRLVVADDLYVALPGRTTHGADHAAAAVAAGARAVLTDVDGGLRLADHDLPVPVLTVPDPRSVVPRLAAELYGQPARRLTMLGITGTNGKTTTSFLVEAALRAADRHCGLIGTLGYRYDGAMLDSSAPRTTVTTPESAEVHALLATLAERGADTVVMEVSSHALSLGRVDAVEFDVAAFTNFGRDHLDFHGSVENYFAAKASLFEPDRSRSAVVNLDDPYGVRLAERLIARDARWVSTSLDPTGSATYRPRHLERRPDGSAQVVLVTPTGDLPLVVGLPGDFNLHNAITALALLDLTGIDLAVAAAGLADARVPGRMERIDLGAGAPAAYVDFAHTPQAVAAVLEALRGGPGRLICVLGAGGDRDPAKREPMGATAARLADVIVATDDNPRTEDPVAIRQALLAGARTAARSDRLATEVIDGGERAAAIAAALGSAGPDDIVAVLGKGHEQGQEIAGQTLPFSDERALREAWAAVLGAGSADA